MVDLMRFPKLGSYSPITITPLAFIVDMLYLLLYFSIFVGLFKLSGVVVVSAAGDSGYFYEQSYLVFVP